jgi:2-polyprenyl-6-methoxyphenol hydroxylase-like FAD-dependent oxidoreductase
MNQIEWDQGQALTIRDEQGRSFPTDILIAADGLHSRVRQQLLPQLLTSASDNNSDERNRYRSVEYRGYRVYRGVLDRRNGPVQAQLIDGLQRQAFQTWAPNRRFAVVPTADGIAWFAAVAQSPLDTSHAGSTRSVQDDPAAYALLVDQFCHPDATATALHDPIAQIIQATNPHLIRYNDAYASPEVHKTLLGIHTLPRSSSSSAQHATDGTTVSSPQQTAAPQRQQLQPVVCAFLGDAAHTVGFYLSA